jgi:hypothetical protein
MESIESLALMTYQKNIEYLSQKHPETMTVLNVFNQSLENGDIPPRYDLEYINDNFDVKELKSSQYLYSKDSEDISNQITEKIDYKKDSYLFEGFPLYRVSDEGMLKLNDRSEGFEDIFPIMNYYLENSKVSDTMKKIEKFIFIGTGLGLHIVKIDEKIKAKEYLIVEDDVELFKLSLFTTPYYELAEHSRLYFSVADDENLFIATTKTFLRNTFFNNRYLKYSHFGTHSDNKIKQIQNALSTQSFAFFPYKQELKKYLRPLEYINDDYKVLDISKHFDKSLFEEKPVLLLVAGPIFKKNLEWVKENHHKFIIVAISAVLNTLYEHNIKPDIVTHIDGYEGSMPLFDGIPTKEFLKDTVVIFGPFVYSKLRDLFTKEQVFYTESSAAYFEGFGLSAGPCVGSHTLMLLLVLNARELYLLGLNLALDQVTGSSHSDDYVDRKVIDMSTKAELKSNMLAQENLIPVQGNFVNVVYSTAVTHSSVQFLHDNMDNIKMREQKIYNLNEGAKIYAAIPTHIESIDTNKYISIDKDRLFQHLYEHLSGKSEIKLRDKDVLALKSRLHNTKEIKKNIEEYCNSVSHTNTDRYLYDMLGIVSTILHAGDPKINNIVNVYYTYFEYVLPLVLDLFNTKGLKNEKRHIKKLDKMLVQGMMNIERIYEQTVEDFIEQRC